MYLNIVRKLKFGLVFLLKSSLSERGLKVYSTVTYPIINSHITVRPLIYWKELEMGRWEFNCIRYLSNVVKKGTTILDIGAWIGQYTLFFSKLVGDTGLVYAFEPDPKAFDILRDNVEKNCLTNVHIEKICINNSVGEAKFYPVIQFGSSGSSLIPYMRSCAGLREIIVGTTTIDKYCEENGICPDGIKIDVEGAEGLVIEGCRNTIEKYSPWILLEFHGTFMSEKERRINWHKIVGSAKKVIFIDGNSNQYHYRSQVKSMPDCLHFHVFIKY